MYMRIAMVGQKGIPTIYGGIEKHVEDLSIELVKQGHDVLVYARSWYTPTRLKNYRGVRIIHTPTIHTKHLDAIVHTFISTIHAMWQKPDVIHFHGVGPSLLSWIPRVFAPKIKVISTFHCIDRYHQKWNWFAKKILWLGEKAACTFPHETITVSKTITAYCLNEYNKNTVFIANGVNTVKNTKQNSTILEKYNIIPNKYILMTARLVKHKGVHYLLSAWQLAVQQNPEIFKGLKLVIVGGSTFTDKYVAQLQQIARGDKSIVFTGWIRDQKLTDLYENTMLYVNPSENEGLPISVLTAMAHKKAVLLSDIPEHVELVNNPKFLFQNANTVALSKKLAALLADKKLLEEAGEKNKKIVEEKFNWKNLSRDTVEVYSHTPRTKTMTQFKAARV